MPGFADYSPDEREQLLAYLETQRAVLRLTAYGLADTEARLAPTASSLSVGGVIKHVTHTERHWMEIVTRRVAPFGPDSALAYEEGFRLSETETLQDVLDEYAVVAGDTNSVVRSLSLDHPVPVPSEVPWFPKDLGAWSLRWVLLHLIEETARHAGHADIVRESIDGATWFPLLAAAENWEPTPFIQPWKPATTAPAAR
jgi:uncharacterized damage-inducible protein DinB